MVHVSLQLYILLHLDSCILGSRAPIFTWIAFVVNFFIIYLLLSDDLDGRIFVEFYGLY